MDPKPLFPKIGKLVVPPTAGPKPFVPVITAAKQSLPHPPKHEVKPLFASRAVSNEVDVEPFIRNHPLCAKLSNKDLGRVRNIVHEAKLEDTNYVMNYADDLRTKFSDIVNKIVAEAKLGKMEEISLAMTEVLGLIKSMDVDSILNPSKRISGWDVFLLRVSEEEYANQNNISAMSKKFTANMATIDVAVAKLLTSITELVTSVDDLDTMFKANKEQADFLNLYIIAGKILVDKQEKQVIPDKEYRLDKTDLFKVQDFAYYKDCVDRFRRKIQDLEVTAHAMLLNVPQIRMMQMNGKNMAEKIQRIAKITVPAWKTQVAVLLRVLVDSRQEKLTDVTSNPKFAQHKPLLESVSQSYSQLISAFTN